MALRSTLTVLMAIAVSGRVASAQSTITSSPSTTSAASAASATDLAESLWAEAESLLSSVYSTSINPSQIATLTWPSVVVIGGSTYTIPATTTVTGSSVTPTSSSTSQSASSAAPAATSSVSSAASTNSSSGTDKSDKRLAIILGVVISLVAVFVLALAVWCVYRRRKQTGTFLKHQPLPDDGEIESWRGINSRSNVWSEKDNYRPLNDAAATPAAVPLPMTEPRYMHPAYLGNQPSPHANSSSSDDSRNNPFYTPNESPAELAAVNAQRSMEHVPLHSEDIPLVNRQEDMSPTRANRPPTPLLHEAMQSSWVKAHAPTQQDDTISPVNPQHEAMRSSWVRSHTPTQQDDTISPIIPQHDYNHSHTPSNPFSSPDDYPYSPYNADQQYYQPPVPVRSPERRHSPQIHYPSGPELSTFDFGLTNQQSQHWRQEEQQDGGDGYQDGGDGYRPVNYRRTNY